MGFFSTPEPKQLANTAILNSIAKVKKFRETILETGTAKQLQEFDVMFDSIRQELKKVDPVLEEFIDTDRFDRYFK